MLIFPMIVKEALLSIPEYEQLNNKPEPDRFDIIETGALAVGELAEVIVVFVRSNINKST
jgi:hypothetical protein